MLFDSTLQLQERPKQVTLPSKKIFEAWWPWLGTRDYSEGLCRTRVTAELLVGVVAHSSASSVCQKHNQEIISCILYPYVSIIMSQFDRINMFSLSLCWTLWDFQLIGTCLHSLLIFLILYTCSHTNLCNMSVAYRIPGAWKRHK